MDSHGYLIDELEGDGVEMEGASVALVCSVNRVPCLVARTISTPTQAPRSISPPSCRRPARTASSSCASCCAVSTASSCPFPERRRWPTCSIRSDFARWSSPTASHPADVPVLGARRGRQRLAPQVHYGSRAVGAGAALIVEATAVDAVGRISPGDLGLWDDAQIEPLARIARFAGMSRGCVAALQLAHAGRKASVGRGWEAQRTLAAQDGGWPTVASPSALSFGEGGSERTRRDGASAP